MTRSITITDCDPIYPKVIALMTTYPKEELELGLVSGSGATPPPGLSAITERQEAEAEGVLTKKDLAHGQTVKVDFGEDGEVLAQITDMLKKNKLQVEVTPEDTQEPETIDVADIVEIVEIEEDEDEDEEPDFEFAKGDDVEFKEGRKKVQGTIKSIDEKKETAKVKVPGTRSLSVISFDKLSLITE